MSQDKHGFVVVANRLPAEYDEREGWRPSPGGLVKALEPALRGRESLWVGWGGRPYDPAHPHDDAPPAIDDLALNEVELTADEIEAYYDGFSNGALWPLYHDSIVRPQYHRAQFEAYQAVNERFAERVAELAAPKATVWVHDYQLQLVPAMLRALRPDLRIGFFLHIPFPPAELFSQLPWRRQLLRGLLGADLVGFQTKQGAANFLALVGRYLGLRPGTDRVTVDQVDGARTVRVDAFPIGIDAEHFAALAASEPVQQRARQIRADLGDPRVLLLGVDRLDYTKGIDVRVRAVGELMQDGHLAAADTVLLQIATPSREGVAEYQRIRNEVELLIGRINGALGQVNSRPVVYLHQTLDTTELAAMYVAADVLLVTPLRDGMNLVAKEYVACKGDDSGALVLSEFTGAAQQLTDAWQVNPYDIAGVKTAVVDALAADPQAAAERMRAMRSNVFSWDVQRWVRMFLSQLEKSR